jgi:hypothetical protein
MVSSLNARLGSCTYSNVGHRSLKYAFYDFGVVVQCTSTYHLDAWNSFLQYQPGVEFLFRHGVCVDYYEIYLLHWTWIAPQVSFVFTFSLLALLRWAQ